MIDLTRTMSSGMDGVHRALLPFIKSIKDKFPKKTVRLSLVGYRDVGDEHPFVVLDFTQEPNEVADLIRFATLTGGGDIPEDVLGALLKVEALQWVGSRRFLIHITDAPCHGIRYHVLGEQKDLYPKENPYDVGTETCESKLLNLCKKNVRYLLISINKVQTDKMAGVFEKYLNDHHIDMIYHPVNPRDKNFSDSTILGDLESLSFNLLQIA
jgi:hypothetical protein